MNVLDQVKAETPYIISKYAVRSNVKAMIQCLNTLLPYVFLFYVALSSLETHIWLSIGSTLLLSLFIVRIFMLMHDCGHKSLFQNQRYNTICGFFTGVIVGMPQYVWSQHHNYHHATNGDWGKYRGPLNILSVDEYEKLSTHQQRRYRYGRNILFAPVGAFMYFIFNPRFNWILGSLKCVFFVLGKKIKNSQTPIKSLLSEYQSPFWKTWKEYIHMTLNNIVLLSFWVAASWYFGASTFFTIYILSLSLAGAAGIIIFTIQHNFPGSYASCGDRWDYHTAALEGTSFLTFPRLINWFGADIAFHHIHHISSRIPNYNLAQCHKEYAQLFTEVTRIRLRDVSDAFKYILWDMKGQKIISVGQYNQRQVVT